VEAKSVWQRIPHWSLVISSTSIGGRRKKVTGVGTRSFPEPGVFIGSNCSWNWRERGVRRTTYGGEGGRSTHPPNASRFM
jgi:hypothetical protein